MKSNVIHLLIISLFFLSAIQLVSADDRLKPMLERLYESTQRFVDRIMEVGYGFFPGLEESVERIKSGYDASSLTEVFPFFEPFLKHFHWLVYVAAFFVIMTILAKIWGIGKQFMINSVAGIILLLILIHVLGVEIKVTILKLVLIAIFGIPGVFFVLVAHYWGIPL